MSKPIAMVVTRWLQRVPDKCFIQTMEQDTWEDSKADLYVAIHGEGDIEPNVKKAAKEGRCEILDLRGGNGRYAPFVAKVFDILLEEDYTAIGLLDDDAIYTDPVIAMRRMVKGFEDHRGGALGPMHKYRHWSKYNNQAGEGFHPLDRRPWGTMGSQIYSTEFLKIDDCRRRWTRLLTECRFKADIFLFMLANHYGYGTWETYVDYFHRGTQGGDGKPTMDWYKRRCLEHDNDYGLMLEVFDDLPKYWDPIVKMGNADLRNLKKKCRQAGLPIPD